MTTFDASRRRHNFVPVQLMIAMSVTEFGLGPSNLETAKQLQATFDTAQLRIRDAQARFNSRRGDTNEDASGSRVSIGSARSPNALAAEVTDYMSFMRRLKFQYLENNAKDKYVKTIVNDEAPMVTGDTNAELQAANVIKKDKLKAAKSKLAEKHGDIRNLAPLVEHDYLKAKGLTDEAVALTQSILDARLAITRLRSAHPHPRLTITSAEEQLASQVTDLQTLEDELQRVNEKVAHVKDAVKEGTKEMDRLRSEKADVERKVTAHKVEADDGRAVDLCDWYTSSLALHRSLFRMRAFQSISENELKLTYAIEPTGDTTKAKGSRVVGIILLFVPNTRQLADVRIEGLDGVDMANAVDACVQANDVPGLIWQILSRARKHLG
ncbi:hypothetical protein BC834DRAFT_875183 [Gloeopeniophorella convolvens]|nr:hypothetical protein BC834DRAFT_875183 [Gloeopeniophorella convolvens]